LAPDKPDHLAAPPVAAYDAAASDAPQSRRSLFGEILDWLLVPMMLLWPVSIVLTYVSAKAISNPPYDRALSEATLALAEQLKVRNGRLVADIPLPARAILRADESDVVYFQVLGTRGEFVAGDRELPLPDDDEVVIADQVRFRDDMLQGVEVRVAYIRVTPAGLGAGDAKGRQNLPLVQVAETLNKRAELANEIVKGVILPQFIVLPLAVTLIWFGLARGLVPLADLSERIGARKPGDLSPIDPGAAPEEVAPLIRAINQLMLRLDASLKGQQRFIANAAHQLRTPLAGLKTQTELALRQSTHAADARELRASLAQMLLSTERAAHMVNQLLALTRAERGGAGQSLPAIARVRLDALVRDQVREWVPVAMARRIDLGCDEERADAIEIDGDPILLAEMVANLIDNALRYTPSGGVINVQVQAPAPATPTVGATLMVEDNGSGIPEQERELVFERFYRVLGSDPEGRNLNGSGLGLAIVREIASKHRARVSIGDAPGGGAVFTVVFPHLGALA